jgi:hypothetical protein
MDDKERMEILEAALAQMLKPIRGIPFSVIVRAMAEKQVIKVDRNDLDDQALIQDLEKAIGFCAAELKRHPIERPRPNEVGNDVEEYVMRALAKTHLSPNRPTSKKGLGKATGYPDILIEDTAGRSTYLECKIFAHGTPETTMRSFYLSPSESFKVSRDARHLLLAFGMEASAIPGSRNSSYTPRSFKLVDLHDLLCDVKYEFNSDNRRLYSPSMIVLKGDL